VAAPPLLLQSQVASLPPMQPQLHTIHIFKNINPPIHSFNSNKKKKIFQNEQLEDRSLKIKMKIKMKT
jgi:hypothetical protein